MGNAAARLLRDRKIGAQEPKLSPQEQKALDTMRREAKEAGSLLASNGEGGLPSSLVLGVFRRDKYKCKKCGDVGTEENGGISAHHKGHLQKPLSRWLVKKGKSNDPNNIVSMCAKCHSDLHSKDRGSGDGAK